MKLRSVSVFDYVIKDAKILPQKIADPGDNFDLIDRCLLPLYFHIINPLKSKDVNWLHLAIQV